MRNTLKSTWRVIRWDSSWKTHWKTATRWGKCFATSRNCSSDPEMLFLWEQVSSVSCSRTRHIEPASFWLQKMFYKHDQSPLFTPLHWSTSSVLHSLQCVWLGYYILHRVDIKDGSLDRDWMCCRESITVVLSGFSDHTGAGETAYWSSVQHFE